MTRWTVLLCALFLASPARADVPPSPDSPDAHCSLQEQCPHGTSCHYAIQPGSPPAPGEEPVGQACRAQAGAKGLERRCRNGGNYWGDEIFCPKGETGSWKPPSPASAPASSTSRCSATPGGESIAGALVLGAALLAFAGRRRRPGPW
jgi:MYXO-CTERM domain-containing protein